MKRCFLPLVAQPPFILNLVLHCLFKAYTKFVKPLINLIRKIEQCKKKSINSWKECKNKIHCIFNQRI
jgi:hypothetical protein